MKALKNILVSVMLRLPLEGLGRKTNFISVTVFDKKAHLLDWKVFSQLSYHFSSVDGRKADFISVIALSKHRSFPIQI